MSLLNNSTFCLIFKRSSDCDFFKKKNPHTFVDHLQRSILQQDEPEFGLSNVGGRRYIYHTECCGLVYMEHTLSYWCRHFCGITCLFLFNATIRHTFPLAPHCCHLLWLCPTFSAQTASFGTSYSSPALVIHPRRSLLLMCTGSTCQHKLSFCLRDSFRCLQCNKWPNWSCCF